MVSNAKSITESTYSLNNSGKILEEFGPKIKGLFADGIKFFSKFFLGGFFSIKDGF